MEEEEEQAQIKNEKVEDKIEEEGVIDPNVIDAHWIQNQLLNYYDPNESLRLEKEILSVLNGKTAM